MYNREEGRSCIFGRPNSTGAARFGQPKSYIFNWEDFTTMANKNEIMTASTLELAITLIPVPNKITKTDNRLSF